jgi:homocitrate synthase NifV
MTSKVHFSDSTLRDGEQSPGVAFSKDEKIHIAELLDELGVAEIDCGIAAMGGSEADSIRAIAKSNPKARLITWNRAVKEDIRASIDCCIESVAISIPASDIHILRKLEKSRSWVLEQLFATVDFAKSQGLYVCVGAEDSTRADEAFLALFFKTATEAGADRLRISDTLGIMEPFSMYEKVRKLKKSISIPLEIHTHNDYGLAVANALAGFKAGAEYISVSVLGLGERAGNASLEEVALAMEHLVGVKTGLRLEVLPRLCHYTSAAANRQIYPGKPVVGAKIFSHESEIHAAGILKDPTNYEPYSPCILGLERDIPVGKHTGRRSLTHKLFSLGITATDIELDQILSKIRNLSTIIKRNLSDKEIVELCRK